MGHEFARSGWRGTETSLRRSDQGNYWCCNRSAQSSWAGLLEGVYEECLCHELALRNLHLERQLLVPVIYKGVTLDCGYRLDILVEETVVLELKSVDRIHPIFEAQLLTYMRLLQKPVGLLINFNVPILKSGIVRKVL